ncbi:MAG TPA: hypothetical protein DDW49_10585 [Deltaproteobacteria bacterium]|nr:hypothetical protein [Deltaproteobacteria bacterium]
MLFKGYHVIVIPRDPQKTKKFTFSTSTVRGLFICVLMIFPLLLSATLAAFHYQHKWVQIQEKIAQEDQLIDQKEFLTGRMAQLERNLIHIEDSLGKLTQALDMEGGNVKGGVGPIDDEPAWVAKTRTASLSNQANLFLNASDVLHVNDFRTSLGNFDERLAGLESHINEIFQINRDKIRYLNSTPNLLPVNGFITSGFGVRRAPYSGQFKMHYGLDIASPMGTPIKAPAKGRVVFAKSDSGYGRKIVIDHGFGVTTLYGHASQIYVKEGDQVSRGAVIGAVGSSGSSTGPHVHYEVHVDGIPTNPFQFVGKPMVAFNNGSEKRNK